MTLDPLSAAIYEARQRSRLIYVAPCVCSCYRCGPIATHDCGMNACAYTRQVFTPIIPVTRYHPHARP